MLNSRRQFFYYFYLALFHTLFLITAKNKINLIHQLFMHFTEIRTTQYKLNSKVRFFCLSF